MRDICAVKPHVESHQDVCHLDVGHPQDVRLQETDIIHEDVPLQEIAVILDVLPLDAHPREIADTLDVLPLDAHPQEIADILDVLPDALVPLDALLLDTLDALPDALVLLDAQHPGAHQEIAADVSYPQILDHQVPQDLEIIKAAFLQAPLQLQPPEKFE